MLVSSCVKNHLIKFAVQPCLVAGLSKLHTSVSLKDTHDYGAVDVLLPVDRHKAVVENKSIMSQARNLSGAVVRWKKIDGDIVLNEDPVLVVGRPFQVKAASDYLLNSKTEEDEEVGKKNHKLIWHGYKRNFKGQFPPEKPRRSCIRCGGHRISGNPCPLCQLQMKSNYNVHFTDIEILDQFICPHTWEVLSPKVTGVCKKQQEKLITAIDKARSFGLIPFTLPLHSNEPGKHRPAGVPTDKKIKVKMH